MNPRPAVRDTLGGDLRRRLKVSACLGAIFALALVMWMASPAQAAPGFPDVPVGHPYYVVINDLASKGIIGGYTNGNFGPNDLVMRQQFAKMAVLTGGYPVSEADVCTFVDVYRGGADTPYPDNYVAVCARNGITVGKDATHFDPYSNITRLQVTSMVVRMVDNLRTNALLEPPAGWTGTTAWTSDPTHGVNARRAEFNVLLVGLDLASLSPTGYMTRGEAAQVLYNAYYKVTTIPASSLVGTWYSMLAGLTQVFTSDGRMITSDGQGTVMNFTYQVQGNSIIVMLEGIPVRTMAYLVLGDVLVLTDATGAIPFVRVG
jgi:hypothetical protein